MSLTAPKPQQNTTVVAVREFAPSARKQTGRRYGPAPKSAPKTTPTEPMTALTRANIYASHPARRTRISKRQWRQIVRMAYRNGDWPRGATAISRPGAKDRPTPKRTARREAGAS